MSILDLDFAQIYKPEFLILLLLLPFAFWMYTAVQKKRSRNILSFAAVDLFTESDLPIKWQRHVPFALIILGCVSLIFAAADPRVQGALLSQQKQIVLVIDVSKSMEATDVAPSRLDAAKEAANRFIDKLPEGYEVGLVSYSEMAKVMASPTMDRPKVSAIVDGLTTLGGTATGDALITALNLFGDAGEGGVIVLLSDGMQTAGTITTEQAAKTISSAGVKVYAIALGTNEGRISVIDPKTKEQTTINVPPDAAGLATLTAITQGKSFSAITIDELNQIYDSVGETLTPTSGFVSVAWAFALLGLLIIMLSGLANLRFGRTN